MKNDAEVNAAIQELSIQRNSMGDRAAALAVELAKANAKIAELEKQIAAKDEKVVDLLKH